MLLAADIGLIFLNPKFTIPNFPSRLTSYIEIGLPVIACTDKVSDIGNIIESAECGYRVLSGDLESFKKCLYTFTDDINLQDKYKKNARALFEAEYTTKSTYYSIVNNEVQNIPNQ
jgi:glycosyltransferase involved in cell wall biosynthesis